MLYTAVYSTYHEVSHGDSMEWFGRVADKTANDLVGYQHQHYKCMDYGLPHIPMMETESNTFIHPCDSSH